MRLFRYIADDATCIDAIVQLVPAEYGDSVQIDLDSASNNPERLKVNKRGRKGGSGERK